MKRKIDDIQKAEKWKTKAKIAKKLNELNKAVVYYDYALELNPEDEQAKDRQKYILDTLNVLHRQLVQYDEILEIRPENIVALKDKADVLIKLGWVNEAIDCYKKVLRISPNDANILYKKGQALCRINRLSEGIVCFNKILDEIDPCHYSARDSREKALAELMRQKIKEGLLGKS